MQPQISFLSPEEQEKIHQSALWLLSNAGMQMPSQEALDIMRKAGARVEGQTVNIPAELVKHAVEKAPKRGGFILYGRKPEYDIHIGKDTPALIPMAQATHVLDLETRERRPCTDKDLADLVRLMHALEHISVAAVMATPQDVPKDTSDWYALATLLKGTSKHVRSGAPGAGFVRDAVKMASLAAGGEEKFWTRPSMSFYVLTRCPLQIDQLSLDALIELSRLGLPIHMSSGPIIGLTCPVTLAGAITQSHAEVLAGLTLSQLVRPGAPVIYTSFARGVNMKTGDVSMASPEFCILKGASGQMGRYLGLPVKMPGLLRDAKMLDAQAGFESGTIGLVATLAADFIDGMQLDMDTVVDFADLVFSDEAMAALKRVARGFTIDENSLALDVIRQVGPGGSFLGSKHTRRNFREEIWIPRLLERRAWTEWEKDGRKDIERKARERAKEILANHQPERLATEVEVEIDRIVQNARLNYGQGPGV